VGSGLVGVALDVVEGDLEGFTGGCGRCCCRWGRCGALGEEGFQALSQGSAFGICGGGWGHDFLAFFSIDF
jgi:hypothetical protein